MAAAALVGGGAFAAASLLGSDDPTPADALPASTFAYAGVDLSKAGGAISLLKKFPGLADDADLGDLGDGTDLGQKLVTSMLDDAGDVCDGLSWEKDFAPWLGHQAAVAGVDVSGDPVPVAVVASTDDDKAKDELTKLKDCSSGKLAGEVTDGWVVVSKDQASLDKVVDATDSAKLSDDDTYSDWMDKVGDPGALTAYAAPDAGEMASKALDEYSGLLGELSDGTLDDDYGTDYYGDSQGPDALMGEACPGLEDGKGAIASLKSSLESFQGAAATLRFEDDGVELEAASDLGKTSGAGDEAGDLVGGLPDDTAVALGISVDGDWFDQLISSIGSMCGDGFDAGSIEDQLSQQTGLAIPDDINTLLGDGLTLAVGSDFDPDNVSGPEDLPFGLKIKGDPDGIKSVIEKIRDSIGTSDEGFLDSDSDGDMIAIGPSSTYRKSLLDDGGLSSTAAFKDVVPDADKATAVLFIDFDAFDSVVEKDGSADDVANYKPLKALGLSSTYDGTTVHSFLRLSTD